VYYIYRLCTPSDIGAVVVDSRVLELVFRFLVVLVV
jgi:hypothetical protein